MAVLSSLQTNPNSSNISTTTCKPTPQPLLRLRHLYATRRSRRKANGGYLQVTSYMEDSNTISGFANKVIGSLPVIGLFARIFSDEGGVGGDIIDFAEFRRRVGNNCSVNDSRAFFDFQDRRGKVRYLNLCKLILHKFDNSDEVMNDFIDLNLIVGRGSSVCASMLLASCSWSWTA